MASLRLLICLLSLPALLLADTTIVVPYTMLFDTHVENDSAVSNPHDYNYGATVQVEIDGGGTDSTIALFGIVGLDTMEILNDAVVHSAILKLESTAFSLESTIAAYEVMQSFDEGIGLSSGGALSSHWRSNSGATFRHRWTPTITLNTASVEDEDYMTHLDSNHTAGPSHQLACAECYGNTADGVVISHDRRKRVQAGGLIIRNNADGTGADRDGQMIYNSQNVYYVNVNAGGWYWARMPANDLNLNPDTADFMAFWYADTGEFTIDVDSLCFVFEVTDTNGPWGDARVDSFFHVGNATVTDLTVLNQEHGDSIWETDTEDTIPVNAEFATVLFRRQNLLNAMEMGDTAKYTDRDFGSYIRFKVIDYNDAGKLTFRRGCRPWDENQATTPLVSWNEWDTDGDKDWTVAGGQEDNCYGGAAQPYTDCTQWDCEGGVVYDALVLACDSAMPCELDYVYTGNDNDSCQLELFDSCYQIGWFWQAYDGEWGNLRNHVDTLKAWFNQAGPLTLKIKVDGTFASHTGDECWVRTGYTGLHYLVVDGYDTAMTCTGCDPGAFHVRNSYGYDWGDQGYGWVSFDSSTIDDIYAVTSDTAAKWYAKGLADTTCGDGCDRRGTAMSTTEWAGGAGTVSIPLTNYSAIQDAIDGTQDSLWYALIVDNSGQMLIYSTENGSSEPTLELTVSWPETHLGEGVILREGVRCGE